MTCLLQQYRLHLAAHPKMANIIYILCQQIYFVNKYNLCVTYSQPMEPVQGSHNAVFVCRAVLETWILQHLFSPRRSSLLP